MKTTPVVVVLRAARQCGFYRSRTNPTDSFRELAAAARKRCHWRLAQACELLARAIDEITEAMKLPPGALRLPRLYRAERLGREAIALLS